RESWIRPTTSAVSSDEQSSTTINSKSPSVCWRTLWIAGSTSADRLKVVSTTLTSGGGAAIDAVIVTAGGGGRGGGPGGRGVGGGRAGLRDRVAGRAPAARKRVERRRRAVDGAVPGEVVRPAGHLWILGRRGGIAREARVAAGVDCRATVLVIGVVRDRR